MGCPHAVRLPFHRFPNDIACHSAPTHFPLAAYRGSDYVSSRHYYGLKRRALSSGSLTPGEHLTLLIRGSVQIVRCVKTIV